MYNFHDKTCSISQDVQTKVRGSSQLTTVPVLTNISCDYWTDDKSYNLEAGDLARQVDKERLQVSIWIEHEWVVLKGMIVSIPWKGEYVIGHVDNLKAGTAIDHILLSVSSR